MFNICLDLVERTKFYDKLVRYCCRLWPQSQMLFRHCCWCGRGFSRKKLNGQVTMWCSFFPTLRMVLVIDIAQLIPLIEIYTINLTDD